MPLPFAVVCDLLEDCQRSGTNWKKSRDIISNWFSRNRTRIDAHDTDLVALLSTLLPEKRTDRVYNIQVPSLEKIVGRALLLGSSRIAELRAYKQPGRHLDLADCVERILDVTPNPRCSGDVVSVEEIDNAFNALASKSRWSSPAIRTSQQSLSARGRNDLEDIYRRLDAREAKWFTRLVLKDYRPVVFDQNLIYRCCNPVLPSILKIRDDFSSAVQYLQNARTRLLPNAARPSSLEERILQGATPEIGIKVGRQAWLKARSIKHCLQLGHGRMSVETKMDGEYCQIHVDPSKGRKGVQIFSKSGKDSTEDRQPLIGAIMDSLRIGMPGSRITKACILEGELLVYSDRDRKILPFHHVRKHVKRRGHFVGTEQDSPPRSYEHLMIMFFDILLLNDDSLLQVRHSDRFKLLDDVVHPDLGRAELVPRKVIDFDHPMAASNLRNVFAKTIIEKGEGLVLKPDVPYFPFAPDGQLTAGNVIKLKKEYIGNFGDVGDFAVVAASFDPVKAKACAIPNLKWTHFYLGCLENKEEVKRWHATPRFQVVNVVELNNTHMKDVIAFASPDFVPFDDNEHTIITVPGGIQRIMQATVAFRHPMVFDLRCFSFHKDGNMGFWSLRFPVVSKIHFDRDFTDTISFEELQQKAEADTATPELEDSQENLQWIARLETADPRGVAVDAASQLTRSSATTPSPRRATQSTVSTWSPSSPEAVRRMARPGGGSQPTVSARRAADAAFAPPPLLLPSPPRSSALQQQQDTSPLAEVKQRKRGSSVSRDASSVKRRRTSSRVASPPSSPPVNRTSQSAPRQPLEDIDPNSSQRSASMSFSFVQDPLKAPTRRGVRTESSPQRSFAVLSDDSMPSSQTDHSQPEEVTTITIPDEEEGANGQPTSPTESHCAYAGEKCQLANTTLFLSMNTSSEPQGLTEGLDKHGLRSKIKDLHEWMKDDAQRASTSGDWAPGPQKILLVESIQGTDGTRAFLKDVEETRKALPEGRRDWITVYDWRALGYLTIAEDETVEEKYYAGFRDPWRRWYVGLI